MRVLVLLLLATPVSALTIVDSGMGPAVGDAAPRNELRTLDHVVVEMERHWYALDQACDNKAAFALAYLMTTRAVQAHIDAGYFADNAFMVDWTISFAQAYLDAFQEFVVTGRTTPAWQEAFVYAQSGQATVMESLLQGMSAHINYDLAIVSSALRMPEDHRGEEFTRVNDALWYAMRPAKAELGAQYTAELGWAASDDPGNHATMALVEGWREQAWRNAQLLSAATTDIERQAVMAGITANALTVAKSQETPKDGTTQARVTFCQAANEGVRNRAHAYTSPQQWYVAMGEDPDVFAQHAMRTS